MTQRQISHATDELPSCSCGRTPKHYADQRAIRASGGHFLECHPCDRRTARYATLAGAVQEWCRILGTSMPAIKPTQTLQRIRAIR